jgi:hypothetical protein
LASIILTQRRKGAKIILAKKSGIARLATPARCLIKHYQRFLPSGFPQRLQNLADGSRCDAPQLSQATTWRSSAPQVAQ